MQDFAVWSGNPEQLLRTERSLVKCDRVRRSLVASGLIDQYALLVHPIALGKGLPIFADLATPRPLTLVSAKAFPGGSVAHIYRPT